MRRHDRIVGIVAGIVLGLVIVALFVFVLSEQTVDAPSISHGGGTQSTGGSGSGGSP